MIKWKTAIALSLVLSSVPAQAQPPGRRQAQAQAQAQAVDFSFSKINRFVFAVADASMLAGAISALSAQGERGKRNLGYLLILAGVATIAAQQGTYYYFFDETNFSVFKNFERDCRLHDQYADFETPSGLISLAEGIDAYAGQDTRSRVQNTCDLYRRVGIKVRANKPATYSPALANQLIGPGASDSDRNVVRNLFIIAGVN